MPPQSVGVQHALSTMQVVSHALWPVGQDISDAFADRSRGSTKRSKLSRTDRSRPPVPFDPQAPSKISAIEPIQFVLRFM